MSVQPQIDDIATVWTTFGKSDTTMSVVRSYRITLTGGTALPTWQQLDTKIAIFHYYRFSPVMADGNYKMTMTINVDRDGSPLETIGVEIPSFVIMNGNGGLPPMVSPLSTFRGAVHQPRRVSRLYWPFPKATLLGNDTELSVGGIAEVQAAANGFLGSLDWGGSGFTLRARSIIRHREDNTYTTIETADTSTLFASQRRRGRGLQRHFWRA